ncbi:MAG: SIR2 family protein [Bauldia sp.]|nr:SIR2 family protein [Bauldia sp.]
MVRDFKAQIFCSENNLSKREIDTADPVWIDRIDAFFRRTSRLPPTGDPSEYSAAFEAVYPQPKHRRQYIDDAVSRGRPCFGHKVLGSLIAAGKVDCAFTTNFDALLEDSAHSANALLPVASQTRPTVAAIDSADRALRCLDEADWPLIAKLHGDYQSVAIKNTGSELKEQDTRMRQVLVEAGRRFGLIFVGYSGRDASIMEAMNAVLEGLSPFPNGLYWVASSASRLLPAVTKFLEHAHLLGVDVAIIECATFDELAADIIKTTNLPATLADWVMHGRPTPRLIPVKLATAEAQPFPILRYSALLVEKMPTAARRIALAEPTTTVTARGLLKAKNCRAVVAANGRELAVFGRDRDILEALAPLGARLAGTIALNPTESWALGLLYDALVRSLARDRPLIPRYKRSGHSLVVAAPREGADQERTRQDQWKLSRLRVAYGGTLTGNVPHLGVPFAEGVILRLDHVDGRWWCGFEPYTFVQLPKASGPNDRSVEEADKTYRDPMGERRERGGDPAGDWRRERWARRYNKNWASIIDAWAELLTSIGGGPSKAPWLNDDAWGMEATFEVSPVTGWSRPGHHHAYFDRSK